MKTLIICITLAVVALLAPAAYSAPLSCGGDLIAGGSGVGNAILCPTIGDAGFTVTLVVLTIESDYTGWVSGNPIVDIDYATGGPVTFTAIPTQTVITIPLSNPPNSLPVFTLSASLNNPGPISGITVTPTSSVVGGVVIGSSSDVTIDYVEQPTLKSGGDTPEPETLGMLGAALVGAGVIARKRK